LLAKDLLARFFHHISTASRYKMLWEMRVSKSARLIIAPANKDFAQNSAKKPPNQGKVKKIMV